MVIYEIKFKRDAKDLFEITTYLVKKYKNKRYYLKNNKIFYMADRKKIIYEHEINCFDYPQYYNYVLSERDIEPMKIAILKKVQKQFLEDISYKKTEIKDLNKVLDEIKNILKALENEEEK